MENNGQEHWQQHHHWGHQPPSRAGRIMSGIVVVAVGAALLARQLGAIMPEWLFTWKMLLIVVGFYVGAKHSFRTPGWLIPVMIGTLFLVNDIYPNLGFSNYLWSVLIIFAGIAIIFKPKKQYGPWKRWKDQCAKSGHGRYNYDYQANVSDTTEDTLETVSIMGGVKKNVVSKNFKGGDVTCVFGGCEIDLMHADIDGRVVLEVTQIFGGTKLIIPSHWEIQSEMTAVLAGIEDQRTLAKDSIIDHSKVLVIKGTSFLGGIDIRSY